MVKAILLVPKNGHPNCPKCGRDVGMMRVPAAHCEVCLEPVSDPDPHGLLAAGAPVAVVTGQHVGERGVYLPDYIRPGWGAVAVPSEVDGWLMLRVHPGDVALALTVNGVDRLMRILAAAATKAGWKTLPMRDDLEAVARDAEELGLGTIVRLDENGREVQP